MNMWDKAESTWALGRNAMDASGVYWRGILIRAGVAPFHVLKRGDLRRAFATVPRIGSSVIFGTACSALATSLPRDEESVLERLVDLNMCIRATTRSWSRGGGRSVRTTKILARFLRAACAGEHSLKDCERLLRGEVPSIGADRWDTYLDNLARMITRSARKNGELRRVLTIEIPASRALHLQSRNRVRVKSVEFRKRVDAVDKERRTLHGKILLRLNLDPRDLSRSPKLRAQVLSSAGYADADEPDIGYFPFLQRCKNSRRGDLASIAQLWKLDRKASALKSLAYASEEGAIPVFDSIGTSTGRVVMREPGLQWMAKEDRGLIHAGPGFCLRYLDFDCFEPTILAVCSEDEALIEACRGDLYMALSEWLGLPGSPEDREFTKVFFLCLLYGRSRRGLTLDLVRHGSMGQDAAGQAIQRLESHIPSAMAFKRGLESNAEETGRVTTILGNWRAIPPGRSYLALNHFLQGTGALIFKLALARSFAKVPEMRLVAPMHDAILASVPIAVSDHAVNEIQESMRGAAKSLIGREIAVSVKPWEEPPTGG